MVNILKSPRLNEYIIKAYLMRDYEVFIELLERSKHDIFSENYSKMLIYKDKESENYHKYLKDMLKYNTKENIIKNNYEVLNLALKHRSSIKTITTLLDGGYDFNLLTDEQFSKIMGDNIHLFIVNFDIFKIKNIKIDISLLRNIYDRALKVTGYGYNEKDTNKAIDILKSNTFTDECINIVVENTKDDIKFLINRIKFCNDMIDAHNKLLENPSHEGLFDNMLITYKLRKDYFED